MMACFCSFSSPISFRLARMKPSIFRFAWSKNRTMATCSSGGGSTEAPQFDALVSQLATAPRAEIVRGALAARGAIVTVATLSEGIAFANTWAAEHLLLIVDEAVRGQTLASLRNAGTVFVGDSSSVAFGDYMTGANHVLPTAGAARSYSGLSTLDFVRWTTWQRVSPEAAARLSQDVARFAEAEGLPGHAAAARAWGVPAQSDAPGADSQAAELRA